MFIANLVQKSLNIFNSQVLDRPSCAGKFALFAMLAVFAAGCTGMGEPIIISPTMPLARDHARIIVKRYSADKSDTDSLYSDFSARIYINGKKFGSMSPGDSLFTDVYKGRISITVDNKAMPGKYSVSLNAKPNAEYKFDISARAESNASGRFFGIFDLSSYKKSKKNTGLFKIVEVASEKLGVGPAFSPVKVEQKKKSIVAPVKIKKKKIQAITPMTLAPKQKFIFIQSKPSTPPAKPLVSAAKKRLLELKKLLDEELITKKDYDLKKRQILKMM